MPTVLFFAEYARSGNIQMLGHHPVPSVKSVADRNHFMPVGHSNGPLAQSGGFL